MLSANFPVTNISFINILSGYKEYLAIEGYNAKTVTSIHTQAQEFLSCLETSGIRDIYDIEPVHIQRHYDYLQTRPLLRQEGALSGSMLRSHIYSIRLLFSYLVLNQALEVNPFSGQLHFVNTITPYRLAISEAEVQTLFSAAETPRERALLCLAYSGFRRTELSRLNCSDLLFDEHYVIIRRGKFNVRREVPLPPRVIHMLREYYERERVILCRANDPDARQAFLLSKKGYRLSGEAASKLFKEILDRTDLPKDIVLHSLRHSYATHLNDRGAPIELIQKLLGHKHYDTTSQYMNYQLFHTNKKTA